MECKRKEEDVDEGEQEKKGGTGIKRRRVWKSFTHQAQTAFLLQIDVGNVQSLDM